MTKCHVSNLRDLHTFQARLPALQTPLTLVVGTQDRIVPPSVADRVAASLRQQPAPAVIRLNGLGHLAHEEQAATVANLLLRPTHDALAL